jgi:hypothetical protein
MLSFDHKMHVWLMQESSELARKYRVDCWIEKDINTELKEKWEEINITREELKDLLKNAWIEFKWNSKTDVLVNLCIENNLI